ncbi:MAG: phosphoribosyl-ATP diphosphatase [Anaerolineaceae bacterium]|nr:phosphoribosyl-ATP diphosphatase [Anaerolineaceae bacterium]
MNIEKLYTLISQRKENPIEGSYTCHLFSKGEDKILQKVGEEAIEVILAAKGQGKERLVEEISDLTYHMLVMMVEKGIELEDIQAELQTRHKPE